MIISDQHFRTFAVSLEHAIEKYGDISEESLLERQKRQIENLVDLETQFRRTLIKHDWGAKVYREFIEFICNNNILAARPYFRERQFVFTSEISKALKSRSDKSMYKFHFNYNFIQWVLKQRKWRSRKGMPLAILADQIADQRRELIEMNMPLAISRARIFWSRTPKAQLEYMDLVQIACEGLMSAIDKFCLPYSKVFRSVAIGRMVGNFIEQYSVDQDTILIPCGQKPKKISEFKPGDKILGVNDAGETIETNVVALHDHGILEGVEAMFDDGYKIVCSANHKFLTPQGMISLSEIVRRGLGVFNESAEQSRWLGSSLSSSLSHKEDSEDTSRRRMRAMQNGLPPEENDSSPQGQGEIPQGRWLVDALWARFEVEARSRFSSQGLSTVSTGGLGPAERKLPSVANRKPRSGTGEMRQCQEYFSANPTGQSTTGSGAQSKARGSHHQMAKGTSRGVCRESKEGVVCSKTLENGGLAEIERYSDMGRCANSMRRGRRGAQTGRLCIAGSQDLGRGGREFSLHRNFKNKVEISKDSAKRSNAEQRSCATHGRNANPAVRDVLLGQGRTQTELARVAYKYAPLANTGNLVLRHVVRIRAVGPRRMYDLEVSHPKHNFLLPNGIVTSNSETLVHFYPVDKRKIYRANKLMHKFVGAVDFDKLADQINDGVEIEHKTTPTEIASLMAAASTVSADATPPDTGDEDQGHENQVDRFAAERACQRDVQVEQAEAMTSLNWAIGYLSVLERKLLRLKGIPQ